MQPGQLANLRELMEQAQRTQHQLLAAQAELAESEVVGTDSGGMVSITMTASGEPRSVRIDPRATDLGEVELLEELVLEALQNLAAAIATRSERVIRPLTDGLLGSMGDPSGSGPGWR